MPALRRVRTKGSGVAGAWWGWGPLEVGLCVIASTACGGTTGREGAPAATFGPDATSPDDPFRLDAGSFDVTIAYVDQFLPDVTPPSTAEAASEGGTARTGCAPDLPFDDAGNVLVVPSDASAGYLQNVAYWAATEYDAGVVVLSPKAGLCAAELALVQQYNPNAPVTPTERRFLEKDVANGDTGSDGGMGFSCTSCLIFNDCLNSEIDGVTGKECEDLGGPTLGGAQAGVAKSQLCENLLSCIFATTPPCAIAGAANICYCGLANAGNACQTIPQGTGACAQEEADGLGYAITDPVDILKNVGNNKLGAGLANDIIACGRGNGCSTCWQ